MLDSTFVQHLLNDILRNQLDLAPEPYEIFPLRGDASNRRYYRLRPAHQAQAKSIILMELSEPEAFKKSEEKVTVSRVPIQELPYINILKHLQACQVSVPELYHYEQQKGLLFLEDLGDMTLHEELKGADGECMRPLYIRAIDELLKIHIQGTRRHNPDCVAFGRAFDVPLLMWEFDHFLEYGVGLNHGRQMDPQDLEMCRGAFEAIARMLAAEPRCLTHRDFHSRNLMVQGGRIRVLDFQDALMGPAQYDLASLLRDSYLSLPEDLVEDLLDYYLDQKARQEGGGLNRGHFLKLFDFVSIQRNLKACGRFAYIHQVKKNPSYLQYIPGTLKRVRKTISKYRELEGLLGILGRSIQELR